MFMLISSMGMGRREGLFFIFILGEVVIHWGHLIVVFFFVCIIIIIMLGDIKLEIIGVINDLQSSLHSYGR